MPKWDVFISHASEDKESFVDPLAQRLQELAVRTWYDKFVLVPGDRLTEKIGEGLAECRCGLLVLSKAFIRKPWTKYELSGLVNRFVEEKTRLIPIWYGIDRADVAAFNPALADLFAIQGDKSQIDKCALEVLRVIRPQLYENLKMLSQIDKKVRIVTVTPGEVKDGPIRHHDLPDSLLVRIRNIHFALRDVETISLEKTIENFQRDLRPEDETEVWERIVCALHIAMDAFNKPTIEIKKRIFKFLLSYSTGDFEYPIKTAKDDSLDAAILDACARAWLDAVPHVTISDVENTGL
jgi:hypothetical protein